MGMIEEIEKLKSELTGPSVAEAVMSGDYLERVREAAAEAAKPGEATGVEVLGVEVRVDERVPDGTVVWLDKHGEVVSVTGPARHPQDTEGDEDGHRY